MSLVWTVLLAMVAEVGAPGALPAPGPARPAAFGVLRAQSGPAASWSPSISRRCWHSGGSGYWTLGGLGEFDTEEVDETWMVHLDAVASVPGSWLDLAWSRSRSTSKPSTGLPLDLSSSFPLRC